MPTKQKYFSPLNVSIQIGGYISTYQADDEEFPYPLDLLDEREREQIKTLWDMFVSVDGSLIGSREHVISNKFADAGFLARFEQSVRESLAKKLPDALKEICYTVFLVALFDACNEHRINFGDATKFKDYLRRTAGEGLLETKRGPKLDHLRLTDETRAAVDALKGRGQRVTLERVAEELGVDGRSFRARFQNHGLRTFKELLEEVEKGR